MNCSKKILVGLPTDGWASSPNFILQFTLSLQFTFSCNSLVHDPTLIDTPPNARWCVICSLIFKLFLFTFLGFLKFAAATTWVSNFAGKNIVCPVKKKKCNFAEKRLLLLFPFLYFPLEKTLKSSKKGSLWAAAKNVGEKCSVAWWVWVLREILSWKRSIQHKWHSS